MNPVWNDPRVKEALKEREADDIAVLSCPQCGRDGYYNQGSHFTCLQCDRTFPVLSDGEEAVGPSISADEMRVLSDCADSFED